MSQDSLQINEKPHASIDRHGSWRGALTSLLLHLVLLLVIALWQIYPAMEGTALVISGSFEEPPPEVALLDMELPSDSENAFDATGDMPSDDPRLLEAAAPTGDSLLVPSPEVLSVWTPSPKYDSSMLNGIPSSEVLNQTVGIAEQAAGGVIDEGRPSLRTSATPADAVNGLGGEIAQRLETGDLLVVWMFDASLSMRVDRRLAKEQMVQVFNELDERLAQSNYQHHHALVCFGNGVAEVAKPHRKWANVTRAMPKIPDDASGVEKVFASLALAVPKYRKEWTEEILL